MNATNKWSGHSYNLRSGSGRTQPSATDIKRTTAVEPKRLQEAAQKQTGEEVKLVKKVEIADDKAGEVVEVKQEQETLPKLVDQSQEEINQQGDDQQGHSQQNAGQLQNQQQNTDQQGNWQQQNNEQQGNNQQNNPP